MKRTIKALFIFSMVLVLGFLLHHTSTPAAWAKDVNLTFASFSSSKSVTGKVCTQWLNEIEKRTGGKVKFNRMWGGTLLKGKNLYQGIEDGIADLGMCVFAYTPGRFPLWEAMDLPVGFPDAKVANRVQWEVYKKMNPKELAGTKVLFLFACSPAHMWSKRPIRNLEDMNGMQIRATGFCARIVKALGGTPVGAPMPEVYEMLAKGIVEGAWSSIDVMKSFKHTEVTKYVTLNGLYVSTFYMVINQDTWASLPKDVQTVIEDYSVKYVDIAGALWDELSDEGLQYAKDKGLEIITLPPEELARWRAKVKPLLDDYVDRLKAKGLPGDVFLDEILTRNAKYSK